MKTGETTDKHVGDSGTNPSAISPGGNTPRYKMAIRKLHEVVRISVEVKINCFGKK